MSSVIMSRAFETAAANLYNAGMNEAIAKLAGKYGFDIAEATEFLLAGQVVVKETIPLNAMPWCGVVRPGCCQAIVLNTGLYTQCLKSPLDESKWCKGCVKQLSPEGTPKYGDVDARLAVGPLDYKVGRQTVSPYSVYMGRHGYTREDVNEPQSNTTLSWIPRSTNQNDAVAPKLLNEP